MSLGFLLGKYKIGCYEAIKWHFPFLFLNENRIISNFHAAKILLFGDICKKMKNNSLKFV